MLAALQAGITHFESTIGGTGGQPANFVDGVPVSGTGEYYYSDPTITGLVSTEDMVVMMDEMGIPVKREVMEPDTDESETDTHPATMVR